MSLQGIPVLSDASVQMPDGDEHHQGVFSYWCRRWIGTGRRMYIEARLVWEQVISEDALETGAVVTGQEHVMGAKLRIDLVNSPVEHDSRAGVMQVIQMMRLSL